MRQIALTGLGHPRRSPTSYRVQLQQQLAHHRHQGYFAWLPTLAQALIKATYLAGRPGSMTKRRCTRRGTPLCGHLELPALSQGPGERDALGRAEGQARRDTATKKGGEGSNNRTAKTAQQGPQGAHHTSIRSLISRVKNCPTFPGCQHSLGCYYVELCVN